MDNPAGYPHTHILNSNNIRILLLCKSKGRQDCSQNGLPDSIVGTHIFRAAQALIANFLNQTLSLWSGSIQINLDTTTLLRWRNQPVLPQTLKGARLIFVFFPLGIKGKKNMEIK